MRNLVSALLVGMALILGATPMAQAASIYAVLAGAGSTDNGPIQLIPGVPVDLDIYLDLEDPDVDAIVSYRFSLAGLNISNLTVLDTGGMVGGNEFSSTLPGGGQLSLIASVTVTGGLPGENLVATAEEDIWYMNLDTSWHSVAGGWTGTLSETATIPVPEPGTALLMGLGLAGLAATRRPRGSFRR